MRRRAGGRRVYGERRARAAALHPAPEGARPLARRDQGAERRLRDRRLDARDARAPRRAARPPPRRARRAHRRARRCCDEIGRYREHVRADRAGAPRARGKARDEPRGAASPRCRPRARTSRVRVVTAASLFDGHDAAINIMRRLLQAQGAEVIHLGHDRSVEEIARGGRAGGRARGRGLLLPGRPHRVLPLPGRRACASSAPDTCASTAAAAARSRAEEARALEADGVARIFRPEDGRALGLEGMIRALLDECRGRAPARAERARCRGSRRRSASRSRARSAGSRRRTRATPGARRAARASSTARRARPPAPVVGFTGTGGAGKSSVVDELVCRFRLEHPERTHRPAAGRPDAPAHAAARCSATASA